MSYSDESFVSQAYEAARNKYKEIGVDTEKALGRLEKIAISMHCWQGDDVKGFESDGSLTGGIQTTGNYPGRARNPQELMQDMEEALSLIPGKHRINLHASYAICDTKVDRDELKPEHFLAWVQFAKERGLGIDFNPTFFSHPLSENGTLSNPDEKIRAFWVRHGIACLKISEWIAGELHTPCSMNIWVPDGFKDIPADRMGARRRLMESLDEILNSGYDRSKVYVSVESKVFGIGLESCTVGSHEFYMNYANTRNILCLLDNGHYHPTEQVSDKISSMLLFQDKLALHVTRAVRWDSDHVVLYDDETREIAKEIIRGGEEKVLLALDFFDASINRIAAWVIGMRNMQKALLYALLLPNDKMKRLQDQFEYTELMMLSEESKLYPMEAVWNYFCEKHQVPGGMDWFTEIKRYEREVLSLR